MSSYNYDDIVIWVMMTQINELQKDDDEPITFEQTVRFLKLGKKLADHFTDIGAGWNGNPEDGFTYVPYQPDILDNLARGAYQVVWGRFYSAFVSASAQNGPEAARPVVERLLQQLRNADVTLDGFLRVVFLNFNEETITVFYKIIRPMLDPKNL